MNNSQRELYFAQSKAKKQTTKFISFIQATLIIFNNTYSENEEEVYTLITTINNSNPRQLNQVISILEDVSSKNQIDIFKRDSNGKFNITQFDKFNAKQALTCLGEDPLYKIYKQYYYKINDIEQLAENIKRMPLDQYNQLAEEYLNGNIKLMFAFTQEYKDRDNFIKLPLNTQIAKIEYFAKDHKLKVSQDICKSIAKILSPKMERTPGRQKNKN